MIALALGLVALVVVDTRRLQLTVALLVFLPLPVLATVLATHYDALVTTAAPLADATRDGHRLATVLAPLVVAAALVGVVLTLVERHWAPGTWLRRGYAVVVCAVAIAAAVAVIGHFGGPETMVRDAVDSFRGPPVGSSQGGVDLTRRFGSLSSNGRITLWSTAWDDFSRNPVAGAGAGSFEWYWAKHQPIPGKARDAHSLYAETLAELGVVGFVLIVLAVLLPLGGILHARRRPVMPFAAAAYVAFIAHLGADWDWEVPVIVLAGLLCGAALLAAARRTDEPVELRPWVRAPAVAVVALVGLFAFTALIGANALAAAQEAEAGGNLPKAAREARKATDWMPWSAEPWKQLGGIQRQLGNLRGARSSYRKAIELEPRDFAAWLGLGYVTHGRQSRRAFATAARLYPFNGATPPPAPGGG